MRFHFGLSFRPKNLIKYIIVGFLGLMAFFGIFNIAKADTINYTFIESLDSNGNSTLSCGYNQSGYCPTNLSFFPFPPRNEYLAKKFYIYFGNNNLVSGHNYTLMISFHILRPESDNDFEQQSFLIYSVDNGLVNYPDTTLNWNYVNYYDSMYGEKATQYNYSGTFTATLNNYFLVELTMRNQEAFYGIFIDSVSLFDNNTGDELIDSNTQNTIDIMNNQNQNTQNIINNNDSNTQQIIDNQNNLLGDQCSNLLNYSNYSDSFNGASVVSVNDSSITINSNSVWGWLQYEIPTVSGERYYLKGNSLTSLIGSTPYIQVCADSNCANMYYAYENNGTFSTSFVASGNITYFRLFATKGTANQTSVYNNVMFSSQNTSFCKYGSTLSKLDSTNQSIQELNDTITDETLPELDDSTFGDLDVSSETAISDLITMPLTILRALNNNLGNSCTPYTIPFGLTGGSQTLTFPCIHPEEYLGSTIWNYIDLFICFFMVYNIAMLIISSFESITSLEDTFNSLYEPRHAYTGYKPKHGGD